METVKLTLDRVEGELAVFIGDSGKLKVCPAELLSEARDGAVYGLTLDGDGEVISARLLPVETERLKRKSKARLAGLFGKKNKK